MRERFVYYRRDFYAAYLKGVDVWAALITGVTFLYFNLPEHREDLPLAMTVALGFLALAIWAVHVIAVKKEAEEIVLVTAGILHRTEEGETLYPWKEVRSLARFKATAGSGTHGLRIEFTGGRTLEALDIARHDSGIGGIEELCELAAHRSGIANSPLPEPTPLPGPADSARGADRPGAIHAAATPSGSARSCTRPGPR